MAGATEIDAHGRARVAVLGLGYVGCVTAACLAQIGHRVIGVDNDVRKVANLVAGRAPFFEPQLDEVIRETVAAGRLSATGAAAEAVIDADIALICVGTPSQRDGNLTIDHLHRVAHEIQQGLWRRAQSKGPLIVAIRSTVFPGTCENVVVPNLTGAHVIAHPEFMREGSAVNDFYKPPLLVFGGPDRTVLRTAAALYASIHVPPSFVSIRTAEMIKYACNAFHAVKIGFANEIGALCGEFGIDGGEVMETFCQDSTLNISRAYLKPGFPFGGSCLPKDLRALMYRARHGDIKLPLIESVLSSNDEHLKRGIQASLDLPSGRIGVYGLAFKANTDDLRESPVVTLLEQLLGKGRDVRVFDPHIRLEEIYGSNRNFILTAVPHIARLIEYDLDQMIAWADTIIVAQKPSPAFAERLKRSGRRLLNLVDGASWRQPETATR